MLLVFEKISNLVLFQDCLHNMGLQTWAEIAILYVYIHQLWKVVLYAQICDKRHEMKSEICYRYCCINVALS